MEGRRQELIQYVCGDGDAALEPVIDEFLFVEEQLQKLKKLPFIKVNPDNPEQQRATPAAKQYKDLLQQYTNLLKVLQKAAGPDEKEEESPLRKWVRNKVGS